MSGTTIVFSKHALEALADRRLQKGWVSNAIEFPDYSEPDPNHMDRWRVFRRIDELGGKVLRVVCTKKADTTLVITAHFDRSKKYEDLIRRRD